MQKRELHEPGQQPMFDESISGMFPEPTRFVKEIKSSGALSTDVRNAGQRLSR